MKIFLGENCPVFAVIFNNLSLTSDTTRRIIANFLEFNTVTFLIINVDSFIIC